MIPLRDTKTSHRLPVQTIGLIILTAYIFYLQIITPDIEAFILRYAFIPETFSFADPSTWLQLVTPIFLHGGFLHIISNMLFLWVFGDNVEEELGFWYLPVYLLGGIAANLGQYLIAPDSPIPIIGASGAVAMVLGAYLVWFPHHTVKTLVPLLFFITIINIPASVLLIYWFVLQLFSGVTSLDPITAQAGEGIAYFAHIGGFVAGVLIALVWKRPRREEFGEQLDS